MINTISEIYGRAVKPMLFLVAPDTVHSKMIGLTAKAGRLKPLRIVVGSVFNYSKHESLKQNILGVDFSSPLGLSAGFDKNGEVVPIISSLGFGFGEVGSVTANQCDGNLRPWFHRLPKSKALVVHAGLPNEGSEPIINRLNLLPSQISINYPIILSIAKTNSCEVVSEKEGIKDYVTTVERARNSKNIKFLEINISCPNTYGGEPFTTPDKLDRLLRAIDKARPTQPVFVKMPIDQEWSKFKLLIDVVLKHNVAGVTIGNLLKDRSRTTLADDLPKEIKGNLSGKPTERDCNNLIKKTYEKYGNKLLIIGVGGIFNANDAYEKIKLGSTLVELITGMIYNGPQIAAQINNDLDKLIKGDGYSNISEAIGKKVQTKW